MIIEMILGVFISAFFMFCGLFAGYFVGRGKERATWEAWVSSLVKAEVKPDAPQLSDKYIYNPNTDQIEEKP